MQNTPIEDLSHCIGHAIYVGFSDIEYKSKNWDETHKQGVDVFYEGTRRPEAHEVEVVAMFSQTWGSTALGFGGIGGASMTPAYTVVLFCSSTVEYLVYFGGRFAYKISKPSEKFYDDLGKRYLEEVSKCGPYER